MYSGVVIGLQLFFVFLLVITSFNDGPSDTFTLQGFMLFTLKYLFAFPLGLLYEMDYDLRLLIFSPVNCAVQFLCFRFIKGKVALLMKR